MPELPSSPQWPYLRVVDPTRAEAAVGGAPPRAEETFGDGVLRFRCVCEGETLVAEVFEDGTVSARAPRGPGGGPPEARLSRAA